MVKKLPTIRDSWVQSLGQEDTLEWEMATHFCILAWKITWIEELAGCSPCHCTELEATKDTQTKILKFKHKTEIAGKDF